MLVGPRTRYILKTKGQQAHKNDSNDSLQKDHLQWMDLILVEDLLLNDETKTVEEDGNEE